MKKAQEIYCFLIVQNTYAERDMESGRLNSDTIIEVFDIALKEDYDNDFREKYKQTDLEFIDKCLSYL